MSMKEHKPSEELHDIIANLGWYLVDNADSITSLAMDNGSVSSLTISATITYDNMRGDIPAWNFTQEHKICLPMKGKQDGDDNGDRQ